jgi:hypothetical protein
MTIDDLLSWLQDFFVAFCDGDWEHGPGIRITTLDNPGWSVKIDLSGTELEGQQFTQIKKDLSETDWLVCRVEKDVFEGFGGPRNLREILAVLQEWYIAETHRSDTSMS